MKGCERIVEGGLIFLMVFTPLAFGTVHTESIVVAELVILALSSVWLLGMVRHGELRLVRAPISLPLLGLLVWVAFQLFPWPLGWMKGLSQSLSHGFSSLNGLEGKGSAYRPLSLYPYATRAALQLGLSYAALFLLVLHGIHTRPQLKRFLNLLLGVGFLLAAFGFIQHFTWNGKIYWVWTPKYGGAPFGPYVNRDHFAGYMEMMLPLAMGLLAYRLSRFSSSDRARGLKERLLVLGEERFSRSSLLLLALGVMSSSLFLTLSRGGILSLLLALVFFGITRALIRTEGRRARLSLLVLALVLGSFVWMGVGPALERFSRASEDYLSRKQVSQDSLVLFRDFRLTGTGLGTFEHAFPRYKTLQDQVIYDHAHNDYVELLTDTGLLGGLLAAWLLWRLFKDLLFCHLLGWGRGVGHRGAASSEGEPPDPSTGQRAKAEGQPSRAIGRRRDPFAVSVTLGCLSGLFALLVHSFGDFNLHIPANALLATLLAAIGTVAAHLPRERGREELCLPSLSLRLSRPLRGLAYPMVIALALFLAREVVRPWAAERHQERGQRLLAEQDFAGAEEAFRRAIRWEPGYAEPHFALGWLYQGRAGAESQEEQGSRGAEGERHLSPPAPPSLGSSAHQEWLERAILDYRQAVWLSPASSRYHSYLGWALGEWAVARGQSRAVGDSQMAQLLGEAEREFQRGIELDPTAASPHALLAAWAISMAEKGAPGAPRLVEMTFRQYREMAQRDPSLLSWPEPHLHLGKAHFLQGEIEEARKEYEEALRLNGSFDAARLELAHLLRAKGELQPAMRGYREVAFSFGPGTAPLRQAALQAMGELCQARPQEVRWHYWLGQLYRALGKREEALGRLRAAIAHAGSPPPTFLSQVHFLLGRLLEEKGSRREAAEEYGLALTLSADHLEALQRLKQLFEKEGRKEEAQGLGRRITSLTPPYPAVASFSPALELLGFALDKEAIISSGRFRLTLYWRPRQEIEGDLQVQAALEREVGWAGNRVSLTNSSRLPSRPASSWKVGEVVRETYEFVHREDPLPSASGEGELPRPEELIRLGFPPGEYTLRVVAAGLGFSVEQKGLGRVRLP